jgi:hypothetical protein
MEDALRHAYLVVGTHSTAILEAMQAGVPALVLPHRKWRAAYGQYSGVSKSLDRNDIEAAISGTHQHPEWALDFLESAVGGWRGDHSAHFLSQLEKIIVMTRARRQNLPSA